MSLKSRLPKGTGKAPRITISLPDELYQTINKRADDQGISSSKCIVDALEQVFNPGRHELPLIPSPVAPAMDEETIKRIVLDTLAKHNDELKEVSDNSDTLPEINYGNKKERKELKPAQEMIVHHIDEPEKVQQVSLSEYHPDESDQVEPEQNPAETIKIQGDVSPIRAPKDIMPANEVTPLIMKLDEYLLAKNMKQSEFTHKYGMDLSNLSKWRKHEKNMTFATWEKLRKAMETAETE